MAFASSMRSVMKVQARVALGSAANPASRFAAPCFVGSVRSFAAAKFTKTHEWVREDGDHIYMGISKFAANALGEVVYCDLPSEGATFSAKDTICTLESVKAVGEVYAPGECEVVEVNEQLSEEPVLVNNEPEGNGWLMKLKVTGGVTAETMEQGPYDKMCDAEKEE